MATNLDKKIKSCSVDERFIVYESDNVYEFMMIQQTIPQQCVLCWAKRELFVYPAMFPHLPEHLASCVTFVMRYGFAGFPVNINPR